MKDCTLYAEMSPAIYLNQSQLILLSYIDSLEVDLLKEFLSVFCIINLSSKSDVGRVDYISPEASHHYTVSCLAFLPRNIWAQSSIWNCVWCQSGFKGNTVHSPVLILCTIQMRNLIMINNLENSEVLFECELLVRYAYLFFEMKLIVPVASILSEVIPFCKMVSQSLVSQFLDIKWHSLEICLKHIFHLISCFIL